jgi:hypothetical protein
MIRSLLVTAALVLVPIIGAAQAPTSTPSTQAATQQIQAVVERQGLESQVLLNSGALATVSILRTSPLGVCSPSVSFA